MFAHQAVEPTLDAAGKAKIRAIEGQHQRQLSTMPRIEPVGQDQLQAQRPAAPIGALRPLVDPGEAVQPPPP